jgi:hypothetical protein
MPADYGQTVRTLRARQTAWATEPAGVWRAARIFSDTVEGKQDYDTIPLINPGLANDFDTPAIGSQIQECSGDIVYPLCVNQAGDWLFDVFGANAHAAVGPDFAHTFSSGLAASPRLVGVEKRLSATRARKALGLAATGLKFDVRKDQSGDSTQRMTVSYMGRSETTESVPNASPTAERLYNPVSGRTAQVLINGLVNAEIISASLDYRTGVQSVQYLDGITDLSSAVERETDCTCSGTIKVRTNTNTFHTLAESGALTQLGFQLGTATRGLLVTVNCKIGKAGQPIPGRGALEAEFPWTGSVAPAAAMLTAVLTNSIGVPTAYANG